MGKVIERQVKNVKEQKTTPLAMSNIYLRQGERTREAAWQSAISSFDIEGITIPPEDFPPDYLP